MQSALLGNAGSLGGKISFQRKASFTGDASLFTARRGQTCERGSLQVIRGLDLASNGWGGSSLFLATQGTRPLAAICCMSSMATWGRCCVKHAHAALALSDPPGHQAT